MMRNGTAKVPDGRMEKSDAELVMAARAGDKGAFVDIVARHQTMVCGIAFAILNDFAASEDAAQETFFTAWRKLAEVRTPGQVRAWLAQIARNAALGQLRGRDPAEQLADDFDLTDGSPKPDDAAASEEENLLVQKALARLPEQYRLPLVLFYCEGHSTKGAATALGLSDDAVRQRLSRGREMLRAQMEGMVETVLMRKRPTALFTMTIAAGIGALAVPSSLAAAAFSASGSPGTSIFSVMAASKSLIATAAAIALISIPVGYQLGPSYGKLPAPALSVPASFDVVPIESRMRSEESALIAEWRALLAKHGRSSESMPLIYGAIQALKDPLRQTAFTAALIAEWTGLDPRSAALFFTGKSYREREQFFREWFVADPREALVSVPVNDKWTEILRKSLKEVAQRMPDMVREVVKRLPQKEGFYDTSVRDAFGILAERDLESAREVAEKLGGPNQLDALAGIAGAWAQKDLDGAIAWAKRLDGRADEVIRSALIGVACVDPVAALERMDSVPPGGREGYGDSTTGARVLQAAARADFATTVTWLKEHPGGLSREDVLGLSESVTERLLMDAKGFLTEQANIGSLSLLVEPVQSALMNRAEGKGKAVWEWLQNQPPSETIEEMRTSLLDTSAWHDPAYALELVKGLPQTPQGEVEVKEVAQALLNGGRELKRFETLYATAPERLRGPLVEQAFAQLSAEYMDSPHLWLSRVPLLPEEKRVDGIAAVARAWARETPEEAAQWAMTQPAGETRLTAVTKIAAAWTLRDEKGARAWLEALPVAERSAAEESIKGGNKR